MTLEEMWARLAQHQPYADRRGYGPEWARMRAERSEAAAREAHAAAQRAQTRAAAAGWAAAEVDEAVRWISRSEEQE